MTNKSLELRKVDVLPKLKNVETKVNNYLRKILKTLEPLRLFLHASNSSSKPNAQPEVAMEAAANEGERFITINGKVIQMPATIRHGIVFQNIFIVVLDDYYSMTNVWAFDEHGNQIWTIEDPKFEVPDVGYALVDTDGVKLMALCRGTHFYIDPKTGKIIDVYRGK